MAYPDNEESTGQIISDPRKLASPSDSTSVQIPREHQSLGLTGLSADSQFSGVSKGLKLEASKPSRNRRKSMPASEQVKHRRTRSGCYTCRSRRVKCDEARPVCERCKKGNRDCVYPEKPASTKKTSRSYSKDAQPTTQGGFEMSSDEYDDEVDSDSHKHEAMIDNGETLETAASAGRSFKFRSQKSSVPQTVDGHDGVTRKDSETPSLVQDKDLSPTPSTESSVGNSLYQTTGRPRFRRKDTLSSATSDSARNDWSHLPPDLQYYLTYFYENVTYLHYSLKFDPANILKTAFIDAAMNNEALLYAVVGFSAFQSTLQNPGGKIQDFLQYYDKAVSLLLKSLRKGERRGAHTILAILQLASIEEFLGDWVNLLGHQKAAYEILTELYTPKTIMLDGMSRLILGWYMRFDAFASLMSGFEMVLDRAWLSYAQEFFQQQVAREPFNLDWKIELAFAKLRVLTLDMSTIFAKKGKGEIPYDQFIEENEALGRRLAAWKVQMDSSLRDIRYLVTDFTGAPAIDPDDIVDPYIPGVIYSGPLWTVNVCTIDWHSIVLMHQYQTAVAMQAQPGREIALTAYASCQLYESLLLWPGSPPGTILALQASLGIACLFLPRDQKHSMWARRHLAKVEANGYIYPHTFRTKMSDLFRDRTCMHWWLPNDEGYPPIIRSIRKFVEERTSAAIDLPEEDLRDMKQIFAALNLDDGQSSLRESGGKRKGAAPEVAVAGDLVTEYGTDDAQDRRNGFNDGQDPWVIGTSSSTYPMPEEDF